MLKTGILRNLLDYLATNDQPKYFTILLLLLLLLVLLLLLLLLFTCPTLQAFQPQQNLQQQPLPTTLKYQPMTVVQFHRNIKPT
jgi:hypothetical protein